ncbi:MAG: hypothetical protein OHM56_09670 [Spiroplasma phoeniceum]|nr:MAG: hypothetical protein OHM57_09070 [Spiroplasma phoeniceum]UZQ31850.1 MAG: hypothetical protein OHM56_09670 [Spiroplasma phoeniceum]
MLNILQVAEIEKFKKSGKTNKLSLENRVVRKRLRFWYKKYFFTIIDEFKTLINQDF